MAYRISLPDGKVISVSEDRSESDWNEDWTWDGQNKLSAATGSEWVHEHLYRTHNGIFWLRTMDGWHNNMCSAKYLSPEDAIRWLDSQGHAIPDDLQAQVGDLLQ